MATHSTATSQPDPQRILAALNAYQQTYALKAAIELDLFTRIGEGAGTAPEIAKASHASERGVRILCDYLALQGFLTKEKGKYALTRDAAVFLDKRSPAYMGSIAGFLGHSRNMANFENLAEVVRGGRPPDLGHMNPEDPIWVEFARSMAPLMAASAAQLAPLVAERGKPIKVLDIAAGHGVFGIAVATHNRAAEVFAVDWKNVLELAAANAAQAGVSARYHTIPGSAFEVDFGGAYDVVLVPNFLHHFDPPTNGKLLRKIRGSMHPQGLLAIAEMVPDEDRLSPPFAAAFSLTMLANTPAGDAYTLSQLEHMLAEAGFQQIRPHSLGQGPMSVVLARA
ncbi:MAG TPA: class I SAM-dependent methyltransferase [Bryobacteraceae bacterium]|nr:class I SAM-dependent methyltransferase [Bryobacteraceae bacterium]